MKLKRILAILLASIMTITLMTACGKESEDDDNKSSVSKEPSTPQEYKQEMIERSLVTLGNKERMLKAIDKAKSGDETTIAYIGGSITEGLNAGSTECYARLSYEYFADTFGKGENVKYVNAGMSGTPSILGSLRADRDVLSKNPDVVFIEFAVNDGTDSFYQKAYESLVRDCLNDENAPAVVLLFTVLENGYTAQDHMKIIGNYYDLPMISVADALKPEFESKRMVWTDYSDDQSHPHKEGHKLVTSFIEYYYNTLLKDKTGSPEYKVNEKAIYGNDYENAKLLDASNFTPTESGSFEQKSTMIQFPNGWVYNKNTGNKPFSFTLKATNVWLIVVENNSDTLGTVNVRKDGVDFTNVNANTQNGWNNPGAFYIDMGAASTENTYEISMKEGFEDKNFTILGIAYTE